MGHTGLYVHVLQEHRIREISMIIIAGSSPVWLAARHSVCTRSMRVPLCKTGIAKLSEVCILFSSLLSG